MDMIILSISLIFPVAFGISVLIPMLFDARRRHRKALHHH